MAEIIRDMSNLTLNFSKNITIYFMVGLSLMVLGLGVVTLQGVIGEPSQQLHLSSSEARGPASIASVDYENTEIPRFKNVVYTVDLGCLDQKKLRSIFVKGKLVRVTGKNCGKDSESTLTFVANQTMGVEGTVFDLPEQRGFSTDYMRLKEGKNNLLFKFQKSGTEADPWVYRVTLHRQRVEQED